MIAHPLVALRHDLHQHPELSGQERETARRLIAFVQPFAPTRIVSELGGTGVAVVYDFGAGGPTLLFRAELDALPIEETNVFTHRSSRAGVSHKCGHDGHAAALAGLAPWLHNRAFEAGRVILLFQPAEETGKGARAVLDDPRFADLRPDYVFSLHNVPGYPMHEVVWVKGQFSPTVQSMAIRLYGKEAHASEPENGINPTLAVADLVRAFDARVVADPARADFALVTPIYLRVGQPDYGISAGYGEAHFTLRTWQPQPMEELVRTLTTHLDSICRVYHLQSDVRWFDYFPTTLNDTYCNAMVTKATVLAQLPIRQRPTPFKFGEDFGWFTQAFPGAMVGLGAGLDTPALHNPDYDFPDELLDTGVRLFGGIIEQFLTYASMGLRGEASLYTGARTI
ncbi:amidohydrolase [Fibrella aquatilis]|uniref:Amidohydrolase n=1 Tax=Fibrella aquatilis TaxID=2817059 RepID=A0A939GDI9_9BACT|nr:amidohydrolase [Fibrella aquatilis]MBO0934716.1 amidohydrolase [Fibrella aquatilis]